MYACQGKEKAGRSKPDEASRTKRKNRKNRMNREVKKSCNKGCDKEDGKEAMIVVEWHLSVMLVEREVRK